MLLAGVQGRGVLVNSGPPVRGQHNFYLWQPALGLWSCPEGSGVHFLALYQVVSSQQAPKYWSCPRGKSQFSEMVAFFSQPLCLGTEGQLNLLMFLELITLSLN